MKQTPLYIRIILIIAILPLPIICSAQKKASLIYLVNYDSNYIIRNNVDSISILDYSPDGDNLILDMKYSYKWNKDQTVLTETQYDFTEKTTTKALYRFSDDFNITEYISNRINDDQTETKIESAKIMHSDQKNEVVIYEQSDGYTDTMYLTSPTPNIYEIVFRRSYYESGNRVKLSSKGVLNTNNKILSTATSIEYRYKNTGTANHRTVVCEYDKNNTIIRKIVTEADNKYKGFIDITSDEYQYTYDEHKNWITAKLYENGKYIGYLTRKIYYKK